MAKASKGAPVKKAPAKKAAKKKTTTNPKGKTPEALNTIEGKDGFIQLAFDETVFE